MKVFISGPITGVEDYREKFKIAEMELLEQGYTVMNPAVLPDGFEWREYMLITISMLCSCDAIYMLPGWEHRTGATMEYKYAKARGLTIMFAPKSEVDEEYDLARLIDVINDFVK